MASLSLGMPNENLRSSPTDRQRRPTMEERCLRFRGRWDRGDIDTWICFVPVEYEEENARSRLMNASFSKLPGTTDQQKQEALYFWSTPAPGRTLSPESNGETAE